MLRGIRISFQLKPIIRQRTRSNNSGCDCWIRSRIVSSSSLPKIPRIFQRFRPPLHRHTAGTSTSNQSRRSAFRKSDCEAAAAALAVRQVDLPIGQREFCCLAHSVVMMHPTAANGIARNQPVQVVLHDWTLNTSRVNRAAASHPVECGVRVDRPVQARGRSLTLLVPCSGELME